MNDFRLLSRDELATITGCKRRAGQCAWLSLHGWLFVTNANGWPQVSAGHADLKMGGSPRSATPASPGPNLAGLRALQAARKVA